MACELSRAFLMEIFRVIHRHHRVFTKVGSMFDREKSLSYNEGTFFDRRNAGFPDVIDKKGMVKF